MKGHVIQMKFQKYIKENDKDYFYQLQEKFKNQSKLNDLEKIKFKKDQIRILNDNYNLKYLTPNKTRKHNMKSVNYNNLNQKLQNFKLNVQNDQLLNLIKSGVNQQKNLTARLNQRPNTMNNIKKHNESENQFQKKYFETARDYVYQNMEEKLLYNDSCKFKQITVRQQSPQLEQIQQFKIKIKPQKKDQNFKTSQILDKQCKQDIQEFNKKSELFFINQVQQIEQTHFELSKREIQYHEFKKTNNQIVTFVQKDLIDDSAMLEKYSVKAKQSLKIFENNFLEDDNYQNNDNQNTIQLALIKPQLRKILSKICKIAKLSKQSGIPFQEIFQSLIQMCDPFQNEQASQFFKYVLQGNFGKVDHLLSINKFFVFQYDYFHLTPLHISSKNGDLEMSLHFLHLGSIVDATDIIGRTPLMFAIKYGHYEIIILLLCYEAKPWSNQNNNYKKYYEKDYELKYALAQSKRFNIQKRLTSNPQLKQDMKEQMIVRLLEKLDKQKRQQISRYVKTKFF